MTRPVPGSLFGLVACAAVALGTLARAQPDTSAARKEADRAANGGEAGAVRRPSAARKPAAAGGKKVIKLDTITVEGRIQKPQAFYILQRSNLNFDELQKTESFVPKVEKSARRTRSSP